MVTSLWSCLTWDRWFKSINVVWLSVSWWPVCSLFEFHVKVRKAPLKKWSLQQDSGLFCALKPKRSGWTMFLTYIDVCFLQLHPPWHFLDAVHLRAAWWKPRWPRDLWTLSVACVRPPVLSLLSSPIWNQSFLPLVLYYSHIRFCYCPTLQLNPHNVLFENHPEVFHCFLFNVLYHSVHLTILNKVNDVMKPHNSLQLQHILWTPTVPLLLSVSRNSFSLSSTWGHLAPKPSFFVIILLHSAPPPCFAPSCSASCPLLPYAAPMY